MQIKLGGFGKPSAASGSGPNKSGLGGLKKASVFNEESSSDEEEDMPMEAKMRMRNVGRDTITSSGPNSFGKTQQGFIDSKKLFERQLKKAMDDVSGD